MAQKNANLHTAKKEKNDEFYTMYEDIEKEMNHYKKHFKNKIVYCNCDDCYESNFFKYFAINFKELGLKKLMATCYGESNVAGTELKKKDLWGIEETVTPKKVNRAYIIEMTKPLENFNADECVDEEDLKYAFENMSNKQIIKWGGLKVNKLKGNGSYDSEECIELLKESDIVATNPPFSLFRDYVATLMKYKKKFIIIANSNAITYKEFFPLLKDNKVWLGNNYVKEFRKPDGTIQKFGNICWFTNLTHKKRNEELPLGKKYNKKDYPKYDNYNAINVDKVVDIPYDYTGVMGVPITFLDKYNPNQFEILYLCASHGKVPKNIENEAPYLNNKWVYARILIKRKEN